MKVIVNPVTLDSGSNGYQLVTAIGAAMKCFEDAVGVTVPRSATIRRSLQCSATSRPPNHSCRSGGRCSVV